MTENVMFHIGSPTLLPLNFFLPEVKSSFTHILCKVSVKFIFMLAKTGLH